MSQNLMFCVSNITVSVVMVTYKHEQFIKAAVLSVIEQIGDFELELIVADDLSPDHTPDIVNEIITNHPYGYRIKYTRHSYNKGMMPNFIWALEQCKGKYIALCDGDDYWTDPYKLQKQVDFLEANPEYAITGHDVILVDENSLVLKPSYLMESCKKDASSEELKLDYLIPTLSMVFRAQPLLVEYLQKASLIKNGDTFLTAMIGQYGKYKYLPDVMGAYRQHSASVWSFKTSREQLKMRILTFRTLADYYQSKGDKVSKKQYRLAFNLSHNLFYEEISNQSRMSLGDFKELIYLHYKSHGIIKTLPFLTLKSMRIILAIVMSR